MPSVRKELDRLVRHDLIPKLNEELANLSASHPKFVIRKKSSPALVFISEHLQKWSSLKFDTDDIGELNRAKELLKEAAYRVNKNWTKEPIDLFIYAYSGPFRLPQQTILHNTKFQLYKDSANVIACLLWNQKKYEPFLQLMLQMEDEDRYILSQNAISLGPRLSFLEREYTKPTEKIIRKYQSLFHELNGHMEKMTRILVGIKKILENETTSYTGLKQGKLANHVNSLTSSDLFKPLIAPFDVTVRNKIAHVETRFDNVNSKIILVDGKRSRSMAYSDFITQMRELAAASIVISHIDNLVFLEALYFLRNRLIKHKLIEPA